MFSGLEVAWMDKYKNILDYNSKYKNILDYNSKYKNILDHNSKYNCRVIEITFQDVYVYLCP
jgi:hypothetical protein